MPFFVQHSSYLKRFWEENDYEDHLFYHALLGTLLPDIRYLTRQDRKETHFLDNETLGNHKGSSYEELFNFVLELQENNITISGSDEFLSSFRKGFAFHVILDVWWKKQIYFPSNFERFGMCLEFADEIRLWEYFSGLKSPGLLKPQYEISIKNIPPKIINDWYGFVSNYLGHNLNPESIERTLIESGLADKELASKMKTEIEAIGNRKDITEKLKETFDNFSWKKISREIVS